MPFHDLTYYPEESPNVYLAAYFHDFDLFDSFFQGTFHEFGSLSSFVCRGMTHDLSFASNIYKKYKDKFLPNMKYTYNARLIMSNIMPKDFKDFPFCIWYPEMPSKDTLYKLIEYKEMHMPIAVCSILLNDVDLFNKLDVSSNTHYIFQLSKFLHNDSFNIVNDTQSFKCFNYNCSVEPVLSSFFPFAQPGRYFIEPLDEYCNSSFYLYSDTENIEYLFPFNYNLVDEFNFEKLIVEEFNLIDKLDIDTRFILEIFDRDLPFNIWFKIASIYTYEKIINSFKKLKYNVGMALVKAHFLRFYSQCDFLPDIDLVKMASISGNRVVFDDQMSKYKKLGFWYQHLDLDNEVNLDPPKIIKDFSIEFKFDYLTLLSSSLKDISDFVNVHEIIK